MNARELEAVLGWPVADGLPVTDEHRAYCDEHGHAEDFTAQPSTTCARCGRARDLRRQHQRHLDTTAAYLAGEKVTPGDCWRTAVACLLEELRDDVPHFIDLYPVDDRNYSEGPMWWQATVAYVEAQRPGWTLENYNPAFPAYLDPERSPQLVIGTGQSPRGDWFHSVLLDAKTGELFSDPHPSGAGILTVESMAALVTKPE